MFSIDRLANQGVLQGCPPGAAGAAGAAATAAKPGDTLSPVTTTSSVLAMTYKDGVIMVADTTVSYGRMVRFRGQRRFIELNKKILICTTGEYSDHQYLERELAALIHEDALHACTTGCTISSSGSSICTTTTSSSSSSSSSNSSSSSSRTEALLTPKAIASYTARTLYNKRCRFNPYWLSVVVAGYMGPPTGIHQQQQQQQEQQQQEQQQQQGMAKAGNEMYLGVADLLGTFFEEQVIATGLGRYFAITLMREKHRPDMTEEEARELLEECMRILFYRDCAASNEVQFAKVTAEGVTIDEPKKLDSNWNFEAFTKKTMDMEMAGCSW